MTAFNSPQDVMLDRSQLQIVPLEITLRAVVQNGAGGFELSMGCQNGDLGFDDS